MDREDGSLAALKANLLRPLQYWYRNNRNYVWMFGAIYYGLHLLYAAVYVYYVTGLAATGSPGGLSASQISLLGNAFVIAINLLSFIAVLTVFKAPAMMVTDSVVEVAFSREVYLRCFTGARLRVAYLLTAALVLPFPVINGVLQLVAGNWSWTLGPLMLTNTLVSIAYWLLIASVAVVLSFLKLSNTMEVVAAISAVVFRWLLWMGFLRLGLMMSTTVGVADQVLVSLFRLAIWAFIFGTLFYFLHRRLIPRLAADYLTS